MQDPTWKLLMCYFYYLSINTSNVLLSRLKTLTTSAFVIAPPAELREEGDLIRLADALESFQKTHGIDVTAELIENVSIETLHAINGLKRDTLLLFQRQFQRGMVTLCLSFVTILVGTLILLAGAGFWGATINGAGIIGIICGIVFHDLAQKTVFQLSIVEEDLVTAEKFQIYARNLRYPDIQFREMTMQQCLADLSSMRTKIGDIDKFFALK